MSSDEATCKAFSVSYAGVSNIFHSNGKAHTTKVANSAGYLTFSRTPKHLMMQSYWTAFFVKHSAGDSKFLWNSHSVFFLQDLLRYNLIIFFMINWWSLFWSKQNGLLCVYFRYNPRNSVNLLALKN